MKNRERIIWAAKMLAVAAAAAAFLVSLAVLPARMRVLAVLPVSAAFFGYFARGHWLALAKKDQNRTSALLTVLEVLGSVCAAHLAMSVTRETMAVSAGVAFAVAGASVAGLLLLPPESERGKGLAALVKAVEAMLSLVALALLLRLLTGYHMPLSSWGRVLAWSLLPALGMGAAYACLFKRRGGVTQKRSLVRLGVMVLYAVALVGFANICLPQDEVRTVESAVTDLSSSRTGRGGRSYYADVLCEGEELSFRLGVQAYAALDEGEMVIVNRHAGALGIPFDTLSLPEGQESTGGTEI